MADDTGTSFRSVEGEIAGRKSGFTHAIRTVAYVALILASIVTLIPVVWLVCAAFKSQKDMFVYSFIPYGESRPTFENFIGLFTAFDFGRNLLNSFFLTCTSTSVSLLLASMGGFALAKYKFAGKNAIMTLMLATMMIPHSVVLAPLYELLCHTGLIDSYWGILLPGAVGAFGMLLFKQAMEQVPDELLEAARMDGCSEARIYWSVVMPIVRPMSGAFCLMTFMAAWNSFLDPMIVLHSSGLFTVPIALSQTVGLTGENRYGLLMAGTLLGVLPPAVLFFMLQKEFIAGLSSGAVKG